MIASWSEQTRKAHLYISISYSISDPYINILKEKLAASNEDHLHVYFTPEQQQLSQFQHYARLCRLVYEGLNDWIAFTDDDDLWAPNRVETMMKACHDADTETECIRFYSLSSKRSVEYVDYAVRSPYYRQFFHRAHPTLLAIKFCDLIFRNYLLNSRHKQTERVIAELYHYLPAHGYCTVDDDSTIIAVCVHSDEYPLEKLESLVRWRGRPFLTGRTAGDHPLHHTIHTFYRMIQYEDLPFSHALFPDVVNPAKPATINKAAAKPSSLIKTKTITINKSTERMKLCLQETGAQSE